MTDPTLSAAQIEDAEVQAWLDMYEAMPPGFRERFQPEILDVDGAVLTHCRAIPFMHFNSVLNLGLGSTATEAQLDAVLARYAEAEIPKFMVLQNPHCQPPELAGWLEARGLRVRGGWDRVVWTGPGPLPPPPAVEGEVALVTLETADEWSGFLDSLYGLPTGPWLRSLAGRPRWHHAVLRREGRIVAARSLFAPESGRAWMGVEAPVPGLMAPSFSDDHVLIHALMEEGLRRGARAFVADVEVPAPSRDTPPYQRWTALGFTCPYLRTHYVPA